MHAREDAGTMLELTVTEFTVSVRAINPVSAKVLALPLFASALMCSHAMGGRCCVASLQGRRVLTVGQDVAVHSHGARVGCKVASHRMTTNSSRHITSF
jgi:hypothetical protein